MPILSISYEPDLEDVASVIYAMWDSSSSYDGSASSQEDVKENIKSAIRKHGRGYADYLCDTSVPENGKTYRDAILQAGVTFRELGKREALHSELQEMPGDVKEHYENGDKVVRIPSDLTPDGETRFVTFFPGRPSWLSNEEFNENCFLLRKNEE